MRRRDGSASARRKQRIATELASTNSEYTRASCEYHTNSGFTATSAAAISAARRPQSSRPIAHATGTVAIPASADGSRSANAPSPSTRTSTHSSRYHRGGEFSVCTIALSVAESDG